VCGLTVLEKDNTSEKKKKISRTASTSWFSVGMVSSEDGEKKGARRGTRDLKLTLWRSP